MAASSLENDMVCLVDSLLYLKDDTQQQIQALDHLAEMCLQEHGAELLNKSNGLTTVFKIAFDKNTKVSVLQKALFTLGNAVLHSDTNKGILCSDQMLNFIKSNILHEKQESKSIASAAYFLACLCSSSEKAQNKARKSKCLERLVSLYKQCHPRKGSSSNMEEWFDTAVSSQSIILLNHISYALRSIINKPKNVENQMICSRLLNLAISSLSGSNITKECKIEALQFIHDCVYENEKVQKIFDMIGGTRYLCQFFNQQVDHVIKTKAKVDMLVNLLDTLNAAVADNSTCKDNAGKHGVVKILLKCLENDFDHIVHLKSFICLSDIVHESEECQSIFTELDGVSIVINIMSKKQDDIISKIGTSILQSCVKSLEDLHGREAVMLTGMQGAVNEEKEEEEHQGNLSQLLRFFTGKQTKKVAEEKQTQKPKSIKSLLHSIQSNQLDQETSAQIQELVNHIENGATQNKKYNLKENGKVVKRKRYEAKKSLESKTDPNIVHMLKEQKELMCSFQADINQLRNEISTQASDCGESSVSRNARLLKSNLNSSGNDEIITTSNQEENIDHNASNSSLFKIPQPIPNDQKTASFGTPHSQRFKVQPTASRCPGTAPVRQRSLHIAPRNTAITPMRSNKFQPLTVNIDRYHQRDVYKNQPDLRNVYRNQPSQIVNHVRERDVYRNEPCQEDVNRNHPRERYVYRNHPLESDVYGSGTCQRDPNRNHTCESDVNENQVHQREAHGNHPHHLLVSPANIVAEECLTINEADDERPALHGVYQINAGNDENHQQSYNIIENHSEELYQCLNDEDIHKYPNESPNERNLQEHSSQTRSLNARNLQHMSHFEASAFEKVEKWRRSFNHESMMESDESFTRDIDGGWHTPLEGGLETPADHSLHRSADNHLFKVPSQTPVATKLRVFNTGLSSTPNPSNRSKYATPVDFCKEVQYTCDLDRAPKKKQQTKRKRPSIDEECFVPFTPEGISKLCDETKRTLNFQKLSRRKIGFEDRFEQNCLASEKQSHSSGFVDCSPRKSTITTRLKCINENGEENDEFDEGKTDYGSQQVTLKNSDQQRFSIKKCIGCTPFLRFFSLYFNSRNIASLIQHDSFTCSRHVEFFKIFCASKTKMETITKQVTKQVSKPEIQASKSERKIDVYKSTNKIQPRLRSRDKQDWENMSVFSFRSSNKYGSKKQAMDDDQMSGISNWTTATNGLRRPRKDYSDEEIQFIFKGIERYGTRWTAILNSYPFKSNRTSVDLSDKFKQMRKRGLTGQGNRAFTKSETNDLRCSVLEHGYQWKKILRECNFQTFRTENDLKIKWMTLCKD